MSKIYFSSDLHFGHEKPFIYEPRGFNSVQEQDETIVKNWNSVVTNEDEVYLLGDLMLGDNERGMALLAKLNGKCFHLIRGNHDTDTRVKLYEADSRIVSIDYATVIKYSKGTFYLCHYPTLTANYDDDKPWHKNLCCLHGHTHQNMNFMDENNPYLYHVGLDSHNNFPVEIEEIIEDIRQKRTQMNNEVGKNSPLDKLKNL